MSKIILIMGSVTTATRLKKIAESLGVTEAEVIHTPSKISGKSCSYSIKINYNNLNAVENAANEYKIKIKGIYRENRNGEEITYHDISR